LEGYARHGKIDFQTFTPLTRLADATPPESRVAREFEFIIDELISGKTDVIQDIKDYLLLWIENHPNYVNLVERVPILKESAKLSLDLSNISKIGLQALSASVKHTEDWKHNAFTTLDAASASHMECELKVVEPIRKLVRNSR